MRTRFRKPLLYPLSYGGPWRDRVTPQVERLGGAGDVRGDRFRHMARVLADPEEER